MTSERAVNRQVPDDAPVTPDTSWARRPLARAGGELLLSGVLRPLIYIHTRPLVTGRSRLAGLRPPVIFAANHASHLDTPIILESLPYRLRRRTVTVAAADYFFHKRTTAVFVSLAFATVPIERSALSQRSMSRIDGLIADGWNILLFPEGTRTRDGRMGRLRSGAAFLAVSHQIPLVPVCLSGTFEAMPVGRNWPRPHRVSIEFGEPLLPRPGEDTRRLTGRLKDSLTAMGAVSRSDTVG